MKIPVTNPIITIHCIIITSNTKKIFTKLHIVNNYIDVCLLLTVKICQQLILLS